MATTGFWPVKGSLKAVIEYVQNPKKTTERGPAGEDPLQTLERMGDGNGACRRMFVSCLNCSRARACEEMLAVQTRFGLRGPNMAYHGYQSFKTGEASPEEAHQIGVETARQMWGDRHQLVVATHLNTNTVHNHMVVSAVSFKDGKKCRSLITDHIQLREISDRICREHGLSVLENAPFYGERKGAFWLRRSGVKTHRDQLCEAVEYCLYYSVTTELFFNQLEALGYEIDYDVLSVKAPTWARPVRLDRLGYPMDTIRQRLAESCQRPGTGQELRENQPYHPKELPLLRLEQQLAFSVEHSSRTEVVMVDLFFLILIELLRLTKDERAWDTRCRPLSPELRIELQRLDQYTAMADLMGKNHIHTDRELKDYIGSLKATIAAGERERARCKYRIQKEEDPERVTVLKEQSQEIRRKLLPVRQQLKTAKRIEDRLPLVQRVLGAERQAEIRVMERDPRQYQALQRDRGDP